MFNQFQPSDDERITPDSARDLLEKLLRLCPSERLTIDEALVHPYVNSWHIGNEDETIYAEEPDEKVLKNFDQISSKVGVSEYERLIFQMVKDFKSLEGVKATTLPAAMLS